MYKIIVEILNVNNIVEKVQNGIEKNVCVKSWVVTFLQISSFIQYLNSCSDLSSASKEFLSLIKQRQESIKTLRRQPVRIIRMEIQQQLEKLQLEFEQLQQKEEIQRQFARYMIYQEKPQDISLENVMRDDSEEILIELIWLQLLSGVDILSFKETAPFKKNVLNVIELFFSHPVIKKFLDIEKSEEGNTLYQNMSLIITAHTTQVPPLNLTLWYLKTLAEIHNAPEKRDVIFGILKSIIEVTRKITSGETDVKAILDKCSKATDPSAVKYLLRLLQLLMKYKISLEFSKEIKKLFLIMIKHYFDNFDIKDEIYDDIYYLLSLTVIRNYMKLPEAAKFIEEYIYKSPKIKYSSDLVLKKQKKFCWLVLNTFLKEFSNNHDVQIVADPLLIKTLITELSIFRAIEEMDFKLLGSLYVFIQSSNVSAFNFDNLIFLRKNPFHVCNLIFGIVLSNIELSKRIQDVKYVLLAHRNILENKNESDLHSIVTNYFNKFSEEWKVTVTEKERAKLQSFCDTFEVEVENCMLISIIQAELHNINIVEEEVAPKKYRVGNDHSLKMSKSEKKSGPGTIINNDLNRSRSTTNSHNAQSPSKEPSISFKVSLSPGSPAKKRRRGLNLTEAHSSKHDAHEVMCSPESLQSHLQQFFKNPKKPALTPRFPNRDKNKNFNTNSNFSNEEKNSYPTQEEHEQTRFLNSATGVWGETDIFFALIKKYKEAYPHCTEVPPGENSVILRGKTSEIAEIKVEIIWNNKSAWELWWSKNYLVQKESFIDPGTHPYDIAVKKTLTGGNYTKESSKYIEVKSTRKFDNGSPELTQREYYFMRENQDRYRLYCVYNAKTRNAFFVPYKNPYHELIDPPNPNDSAIKEIKFTLPTPK